jgi:hypothetical protein
VNVDTRESDLTRFSAATLQRWQALWTATPASNERAVVAKAPSAAAPPGSLGYTLLLIGAALLVLEIFMANHYLTVRREVPR